jgi:hypothetical protein
MKHFFAATFSVVFALTSLDGQVTFQRNYGNTQHQWGHAVKQCYDDGYIMCGGMSSTGYSGYVVRTDAMGDTLWMRAYNTGDNMSFFDIIQTTDSCFVVCGYRTSSWPQVQLIKIDQNGDTLWTRLFGSGDFGQSIQQTYDGGFIVAGSRLFKTDANGNLLWSQPWPNNQYMYVVQTPDSGYAMAGFTNVAMWLTKTDTAGVTEWSQSYPGEIHNATNNVLALTNDGGYIIAGEHSSYGTYIVRTNPVGDTLWTRSCGLYYASGIVPASDGGFVVSATGFFQMHLNKIDSLGNLVWTQAYGYAANEECQSLVATNDGGYALLGRTSNFASQLTDFFLVKTDSTGYAIGVGMNEHAAIQRSSVYPNPASTSATILFKTGIRNAQINLYNSRGELVRSTENISGNYVEIERQNLCGGIYFITVFENGQLFATEKIIFTE